MKTTENEPPEWLGGPTGDDDSNSDAHRDEAPRPPCPRCGKTDKVVPIIYGMPAEELFREQEAGLVRLGGCCLPESREGPWWYCTRDRQEY
jgi:hypothetical protein